VVWILNSSLFLIFKSIHFDTCIRTPNFTNKCAQLNSLLWRSCWDRILVNLPDFSHKVWTPLKFIEIQIKYCSIIYGMNSLANLKLTQLTKLFKILKYIPMQSLNIFGAWNCFLFKFASFNWDWKFGVILLLGRAHLSAAHFRFWVHGTITRSHAPPSSRWLHSSRTESLGAGGCQSSLPHVGWPSYPCARTSPEEATAHFASPTHHLTATSSLLCSTPTTALPVVASHRRAASEFSDRTKRSASSPRPSCTECLRHRLAKPGNKSFPAG
jgi:hypothetical protein